MSFSGKSHAHGWKTALKKVLFVRIVIDSDCELFRAVIGCITRATSRAYFLDFGRHFRFIYQISIVAWIMPGKIPHEWEEFGIADCSFLGKKKNPNKPKVIRAKERVGSG